MCNALRDELPETRGASWTVRNRVVKMSKGKRQRERIEMGKDEKAWRKSAIGFDGRITKNHARVGPRGEKLEPRLEKQ